MHRPVVRRYTAEDVNFVARYMALEALQPPRITQEEVILLWAMLCFVWLA
jgi:hypothetical protein